MQINLVGFNQNIKNNIYINKKMETNKKLLLNCRLSSFDTVYFGAKVPDKSLYFLDLQMPEMQRQLVKRVIDKEPDETLKYIGQIKLHGDKKDKVFLHFCSYLCEKKKTPKMDKIDYEFLIGLVKEKYFEEPLKTQLSSKDQKEQLVEILENTNVTPAVHAISLNKFLKNSNNATMEDRSYLEDIFLNSNNKVQENIISCIPKDLSGHDVDFLLFAFKNAKEHNVLRDITDILVQNELMLVLESIPQMPVEKIMELFGAIQEQEDKLQYERYVPFLSSMKNAIIYRFDEFKRTEVNSRQQFTDYFDLIDFSRIKHIEYKEQKANGASSGTLDKIDSERSKASADLKELEKHLETLLRKNDKVAVPILKMLLEDEKYNVKAIQLFEKANRYDALCDVYKTTDNQKLKHMIDFILSSSENEQAEAFYQNEIIKSNQ